MLAAGTTHIHGRGFAASAVGSNVDASQAAQQFRNALHLTAHNLLAGNDAGGGNRAEHLLGPRGRDHLFVEIQRLYRLSMGKRSIAKQHERCRGVEGLAGQVQVSVVPAARQQSIRADGECEGSAGASSRTPISARRTAVECDRPVSGLASGCLASWNRGLPMPVAQWL